MRVFLALLIAVSVAYSDTVTVHWKDTPVAFAGKIVRVELVDGTALEGSWIGITPDSFTLKVNRSADARFAKRAETLPRSSLRKLGIRERRIRGRVLGTLIGYLATAAIVIAASQNTHSDSPVGGVTVLIGGATGFFIGRHLDHRVEDRVVLIDP